MGRAWAMALWAGAFSLACGSSSQNATTNAGGGRSGSGGTMGVSAAGTSMAGAVNAGSAGTASTLGGAAGVAGAAGGPPAAPIPIADLCPLFTADLCRYLMECDGARYRDAAQCAQELDCFGLPQLLDANARGAVDYDPAQVGTCNARFNASPCTFGFFLTTPDIYEVLSFCPGAVTPKLGAGDACSSSGECSAGLYCNKGTTYTCPGQCQALATQGEPCAGSVRCADGLTCTGQACEPEQKAGDACTGGCSYSLSCPSDQICDGDIWCDATLKQCQLGRMVGQACGFVGTGAAESLVNCAVNLWCDEIGIGAGSCRAPSTAGAPCNDQPNSCTSGLHCVGYVSAGANATLGTCSVPSAAGTDCVGDLDCQSGLVCVAQKCAPPVPVTGACEEDDNCAAGLICQTGHCQTALYPGDPCSADAPCAFSRCVSGICQDYVKVGQPCSADGDCATDHCINGACYDNSICQVQ